MYDDFDDYGDFDEFNDWDATSCANGDYNAWEEEQVYRDHEGDDYPTDDVDDTPLMTRAEIWVEIDRLNHEGLHDEADALYEKARWICECGRPANEQYDAYGIYAGRHCDSCFRRKFRQDHYFDPGYAGESLDEDW